MNTDYLSRPIMIHCCRDGTITYRTRKQRVFNGKALPVFSVDTEEQAKQLQIHFCRRQYQSHPLMPDKPWYILNSFSGEIEGLVGVSEMMNEWWQRSEVQV